MQDAEGRGVTFQGHPEKISQELEVGALRNRKQQLGAERAPRINFLTSFQKGGEETALDQVNPSSLRDASLMKVALGCLS